MRPGDRFDIVNKGKMSFDETTFSKLYLPILGANAVAIYQLLRVSDAGKLSALMDTVNIGIYDLEMALEKLSALALLKIYDNQTDYHFELKSPLSYEKFLEDNFYLHLLLSKIGEKKVSELSIETPKGRDISKKFTDVFSLPDDVVIERQSVASVPDERLDLEAFERLMAKQGLTYAKKDADILHLYSLAEKFDLDWYALFKLAEETANADKSLNTFAMTRQLIGQSAEKPVVPDAYQELVRLAKSVSPESFLTQLKRQIGGFVSNDELKILSNLTRQHLSAEAQNILIHYVLVQQKNASLSAVFVNRIANDWLRKNVQTAEEAVARLTEVAAKPAGKTRQAKKSIKAAPEWAKKEVQKELTADEKKEFEALRQAALKEM